MKPPLAFVYLLAMAIFGQPASAEDQASARQAIANYKQGDRVVAIGIREFVDGLNWANADLRHSNAKEIYCLPDKLILTTDQEVDIVERYLEKAPNVGEFPIQAGLLMALKDTFPCPH